MSLPPVSRQKDGNKSCAGYCLIETLTSLLNQIKRTQNRSLCLPVCTATFRKMTEMPQEAALVSAERESKPCLCAKASFLLLRF